MPKVRVFAALFCLAVGFFGLSGSVACGQAAAESPAATGSKSSPQQALDERVAALIEQLGSSQYLARVRAQRELEALGLTAFDALHQARHHDDIEIAMRARFLVRSMRIDWAQEGDSSQVRRILKNYGQNSVPERRTRMEQLAQLDEFAGLKALCRLVRYEADSRLSKRAALLVMDVNGLSTDEHRQTLSNIISEQIGNSRRDSSQWLLAFRDTLRQPEGTLKQWDAFAKQ